MRHTASCAHSEPLYCLLIISRARPLLCLPHIITTIPLILAVLIPLLFPSAAACHTLVIRLQLGFAAMSAGMSVSSREVIAAMKANNTFSFRRLVVLVRSLECPIRFPPKQLQQQQQLKINLVFHCLAGPQEGPEEGC